MIAVSLPRARIQTPNSLLPRCHSTIDRLLLPLPGALAVVPAVVQVLYPALTLKNAEMVVNFGDTPFKFEPPQGFVGVSKAPADATVSAAAAATAAAAGSSSERKPLCLVLEPSRDLAEQTHKCFQAYGKHLTAPALSSVLLVGGVDAGPQFRALKEGGLGVQKGVTPAACGGSWHRHARVSELLPCKAGEVSPLFAFLPRLLLCLASCSILLELFFFFNHHCPQSVRAAVLTAQPN